jgi:hypothetical protein
MSTEPTTALPSWDEMSDLDKGAALMHAHKRDWEGVSYAVENYPAAYLDHPALIALDEKAASGHAAEVTDGWDDWDPDEVARLYDLACYTDRKPGGLADV